MNLKIDNILDIRKENVPVHNYNNIIRKILILQIIILANVIFPRMQVL